MGLMDDLIDWIRQRDVLGHVAQQSLGAATRGTLSAAPNWSAGAGASLLDDLADAYLQAEYGSPACTLGDLRAEIEVQQVPPDTELVLRDAVCAQFSLMYMRRRQIFHALVATEHDGVAQHWPINLDSLEATPGQLELAFVQDADQTLQQFATPGLLGPPTVPRTVMRSTFDNRLEYASVALAYWYRCRHTPRHCYLGGQGETDCTHRSPDPTHLNAKVDELKPPDRCI